MQATMRELADWLKAHDDYIVIGHVNPDGDCIGSCMGVALALRALGKRAVAVIPGDIPHVFHTFPHVDAFYKPDDALPYVPKTGLALDISEKKRMGDAERTYDACENSAMMDHHVTNPGFGEIYRVEGDSPATGQMAVELVEALGVKLDQDIATWLFIAISSDTGHFRFSGTSPETLRLTAKLLEAGVDIAEVTRQLWYTRTLPRTKLLATVLNGLEVSEDGKMAWARITEDMFAACNAERPDAEGIVNYLLEIEGVQFAALAEQRGENTKFSLRSKGALDVAADVAVPLGGGGHRMAAGCTIEAPVNDALGRVLERAKTALERTV